jgi:hypothetical protein
MLTQTLRGLEQRCLLVRREQHCDRSVYLGRSCVEDTLLAGYSLTRGLELGIEERALEVFDRFPDRAVDVNGAPGNPLVRRRQYQLPHD